MQVTPVMQVTPCYGTNLKMALMLASQSVLLLPSSFSPLFALCRIFSKRLFCGVMWLLRKMTF